LPDGNAAQRRKQKREQQRPDFSDGKPRLEMHDEVKPEENPRHPKKDLKNMPQNSINKWWPSAGSWTAVFTGVLCVFTGLLWRVSYQTTQFNAANQRAIINFIGPMVAKKMTPDGKKIDKWQVNFGWVNNGKNPAKNGFAQYNFSLSDKAVAKDTDFDSLPTRETIPLIVGPGLEYMEEPVDLTDNELKDVSNGKQHLFFWGWMTYDDGNPGSPKRLTEFCSEVAAVNWTGPDDHSDVATSVQITAPPCIKHNCYDDSCEDYIERTRAGQ
jgi:hypothetical protein